MRGHMQLTAPLLIACSALLLCIGVIAGLTGSLIMQASNSGRPGPAAAPAVLAPAYADGATVQAPAMGNALLPADIPMDLRATIPPATNAAVPDAVQTPPPQEAANAATPPIATPPVVAASQPPYAAPPVVAAPQPPYAALPAAAAPQSPAASIQQAPPMVGAITSAAEAQGNEVDPARFQQDLQPMGQWVATPDYGTCWAPRGVAMGWRPYTQGRWMYTECGWTWASEEPWGNITYHYGSWVDYPSHGWIWVPGRVWAPAWVAWRVGGGYVGWAPLPPAACRRDVPVAIAVVLRIPTPYFCFVGERDFGDEHIGRRMRPIHQNVTIIVQTRNSTHIEFGRTTVVNRSLSIEQVEHMTGRRPREVRLGRSDNHHDAEQRRERGEPVAYRPRPRSGDHNLPLPPAIGLPGLPKPPVRIPTPPGLPTPPLRVPTPPGLPTPRIPVPMPPLPGIRSAVVRPADPTPDKPVQPSTPVGPPKQGNAQRPGGQPLPMPPAHQDVPAADKPKDPVARPAGPELRNPNPARSGENRPVLPSEATKLPLPPQRPVTDNKPTPTPPAAIRPVDPQPRPADPQPAPKPTRDRGNSDTPSGDRPTPPPVVRPPDPPQRRPEPQPAPRPPRDRGNSDTPPGDRPTPPPVVRPPDPPQRRPEPQPAPRPTRDRGNSDTPSGDRPTPPPFVRPPDPTPAPERRRERAPEQASPPPAPRAPDRAPRREETRAQPQQSEPPQRRRPAPADNTADYQNFPPGQPSDNPGKGGNSRRGGR